MTQSTKTAIQQAEKQLEQERKQKLQDEIYDYLKQELESIDSIEQRIAKLNTEKVAHQENIKNIKQGNLDAIEKRRISFPYTFYSPTPLTTGTWTTTLTGSSNAFYNTAVAGLSITTSSGKTTIF